MKAYRLGRDDEREFEGGRNGCVDGRETERRRQTEGQIERKRERERERETRERRYGCSEGC